MEAVPRLPMISFQLKVSPEPTSFSTKLKQYIQAFYNEDPESYTNEIHQLENLRASAVRPPIAVTGCSLLKKYYCQLHFVQSRFPMGNDEAAAVPFSWRDSYANMVYTLPNIRFEIISILYNIGAIHTQLGARTERTSADGMKMACSHFQCAAWAFEHLQNSYPHPPGVDMAPELMKFMHQLSLAQAQECILEKSMLDNRKPTIVAKVAKQIVDYYALALWTLDPPNVEENPIAETVGLKVYKSWMNYVKFKRAYHTAVTLLYQGLASEEQQKMGERVAFYNAALASLNNARSLHTGAKSSGGITGVASEKEAIEEALVFTNDVIEGKRKAAKNENEFIYHEEVPDKDALPIVTGASLVKGISFNVNDPEVSGPDIFARLVPMKVHEASSVYSEEKAKILRSVGTKVEEKDQVLEMHLASLKLQHLSLWDPDCESPPSEYLLLPEELAERCAALNAKPTAIQDLENIMTKLSTTYGDVETMLKDIDNLLTDEEQKEKQYQEAVGKRPPSIVATDLTREAKKYEEAHAKASESNQALHRAMNLHLNNLRILSQPLDKLTMSVPSFSRTGKSESEINKQNIRELKRILAKVDEMQRQRSELYSKLRDSISQDNLTRLLVTATAESAPLDALFAEQLEKHQSLVNLINQNLIAQDNILAALTDAYAHTAETRKSVEETMKRRELMISSLIASYDAYEDLIAKASKGLEFYRKLEVNVTKLLQRVKSTCRVQEEEREQILARNGRDTDLKAMPTPEKKAGSGMKLRDHLANRLKTNPNFPSTYTEKQTIPVAPVQPNAHAAIKPYAADNVSGADNIPIHAVPPVAADPSLQDAQQMYQYYNYANYYANSRNSYIPQQYSMDNANYTSMNHNMPKCGTTNSDNMYNQAGGSPMTEVVSNSTQYAGYNNVAEQMTVPPAVNQTQYPVGYEDSSNYQQYPTYSQAYQSPGGGYSGVQGQQSYNNQPYSMPDAFAHTLAVQTVTQQPSNIPPAANIPQGTPTHLQYDRNIQGATREAYVHPYQVQPAASNSPNNYSATPPVNQVYPTSEAHNSQYPANPTPQASYPMMSVGYHATEQFMTSQATAVGSNETPTQPAYTGSLSNVSASNSIDQQRYYSPNTQTAAVQPATAYVMPSQQGYTDPSTVQASVPGPQMQVTPSVQTYPSAYGQTYSADAHAPQYQTPPVASSSSSSSSSTMGSQGLAVNYDSNPDIIQSHAKSTNIQEYMQSLRQYGLSGRPGVLPYQAYPQGYPSSWDGQQPPNSMTDSYKGHPGYAFNPATGNYQYSSGYQNSSGAVQEVHPTPESMVQAASCYTNANNVATTNLTPSSQYLNDSQSATAGQQSYYNNSYGSTQGSHQTNTNYSETYSQSANNSTTTTDSGTKMPSETAPKVKSNLDLLADLDITINHAPLVPEVPLVDKVLKDETNSSSPDIPESSADKCDDSASSQIDDKHENLQIVWDTWYNDVQPKKDPLGDPVILQKFITDIEKYEKFVDSLTVKTLSGSTNLDIKWREVQEFEERELKKQTTSVAALHSSENRSIDWIPYDSTRVKLADRASDYINASHVKDLTQWTPTFIVAQAPKPQTFEAFWTMIWEQGSEVIACLCTDAQLNGDIYWPMDADSPLTVGCFTLSLKSTSNHTTYIQRVVSVKHSDRKSERVVVHMQYLAWPMTGLPSSPGPFLSFATDIMTEQALRHCPKPIVVHCLHGGLLSGLFLLATSTVCHVRAGHGIVDVPLVFSTLVKYRRCLISKEFLLFGYRMVLYHAQDTLMKRGILSSTRATFDRFDGMKSTKGKAVKKNQHCHPSDDFLHNLGVGMQHRLGRQGNEKITPPEAKITADPEEKTDRAKPVDPLSQLDPLWSIRR